MKLFVDIEPSGKHIFQKEEILNIIKEFAPLADLHLGVIDDVVKHLSQGEKIVERRIAKGTPAVEGSDGKPLFLVKKLSAQGQVKIDHRGYANYADLHLFDNVQKGQQVARIYPPKNGTDGKDALGNSIASKLGKPFKFTVDKTLQIQEIKNKEHTFQLLIAENEGYLADEGGKYSIKEELFIKDNIDFKCGSIEFIGKVKINGDVMQGFNITAKKGIEINGSVRGGSLTSLEGDIVVKGFVFGGSDSQIICGRSFIANVVQEVNAEIVGDIIIHKEAIDSNLRSEAAIFVPNGQLVGGQTLAVCGVEAKFISNEAGKETKIFICSDVETHTDYARLLASIESHEKAKKLLLAHLGPLAHNPVKLRLLKPPHDEHMKKLYTKLQEVDQSRIRLLAKKKTLLESAKKNEITRINYLDKCYAGTVIKSGDDEYTIKDSLDGPGSIEYFVEAHKFEVGELKGLECTYKSTEKTVGANDEQSKK